MLSKGLIKLINSLNIKKYREKHQLYVAEGEKLVNDLIHMHAPIRTIISSKSLITTPSGAEIILCQASEIGKIGFLKHSPGVIALVHIPATELVINNLYHKLSIGLDGIQDPGNMGTIIRLANWFGIEHIICSPDCVDIYNPKVVQASMGALMGTKIHYYDLAKLIDILAQSNDYQIYGTFMGGTSIYGSELKKNGLLIMGNEGQGISGEVSKKVSRKIAVPAFYGMNPASESLNVGVAAGIIISEFVRQSLYSYR